MSGWIKFEKAIESDPRVMRMAKALGRRFELIDNTGGVACNAWALPAVTLVCGALSRLWMYADTHAREDDTLDLGTAEIDELVGIPGFCDLMPEDWLVALDDERVELPGFQAHNGVEAKKKAQTAKRVARHRDNVKRSSVTSALPDQTRPDQTKTRPDHIQNASPPSVEVPRETRLPERNARTLIAKVRELYPAGLYRDADWALAERDLRRRIDDGDATAPDMVAAVAAYAMQQQALGRVGTQFVLSPAKFFNGSGAWKGPFPVPATAETASEQIRRLNGLSPPTSSTQLHPAIDVTPEPVEDASDAA